MVQVQLMLPMHPPTRVLALRWKSPSIPLVVPRYPGVAKMLSRAFSFPFPNDAYRHSLPLEASSRYETPAFKRIDTELADDLDYHARYWWSSSGYALAILLERAGYSANRQYKLLEFFYGITPSLGPALLPGKHQWKSFMTDDHNPIELSWDWQDGTKSPQIRLSMEPVGIEAGLPIDPYNSFAGFKFRRAMVRLLPNVNLIWLDHFQQQLHVEEAQRSTADHPSREFYGFDLNEDSIVGKAYLFPWFKAKATKRSCFDVISDAIRTLPDSTPHKLQALDVFREYVNDPSTPPLEMEMLAIDLIEPAKARFKIYFRTRNVSFASVKDALTLGGRVWNTSIDQGLRRLESLFHALLGGNIVDGVANKEIPFIDHRTAGILFYVQFRYLDERPTVKAYLPVRHYAQSEKAIVTALKDHLCQDASSLSPKTNILNYTDAITTLW
ncbi:hypothetical protein GQX73_g1921 [Xylaria multiplex]|uniref:Uncharacterized protein n=1 Tax=Xylaria multiplex TaxID=323545 RepID=A0A7C8IT32_9PEZI|nr:hypothetical protein GQX73_g1921 [Xylaria multiplex]